MEVLERPGIFMRDFLVGRAALTSIVGAVVMMAGAG